MPATEKDLAEDAPWKKIQQNTFTRWCNEHLKCMHKRIGDLQKDLSDGLKLIGLLEVLSQKKMYRKYHARPNFRQMKLENVSVALEFLDREHIKLVSIGESTPPIRTDARTPEGLGSGEGGSANGLASPSLSPGLARSVKGSVVPAQEVLM
ncbi:Filamin-C, partial [Ophiophagus hannah]